MLKQARGRQGAHVRSQPGLLALELFLAVTTCKQAIDHLNPTLTRDDFQGPIIKTPSLQKYDASVHFQAIKVLRLLARHRHKVRPTRQKAGGTGQTTEDAKQDSHAAQVVGPLGPTPEAAKGEKQGASKVGHCQ